MSKRRKAGEVVCRVAGSGFCCSAIPQHIQVPIEEYEDNSFCMLGCGDPDCREWPNLKIIGGDLDGSFMYHISECEMEDYQ